MNYNLVFIGNSHISQFDLQSAESLYNMSIDSLEFPGASVKGLINFNSQTGLYQKIKCYDFSNKLAIFNLGQCDIEFGYYYKSVKSNNKLGINIFIDDVIEKYDSFLANIEYDFIVLAINPCVVDDIRHNFYVNWYDNVCHKENYINETGALNHNMKFEDYLHIYNDDLKTRNNYHKLFNDKLAEMCKLKNYKFINLYYEITNKDIVLDEFKNNSLDHHLKKNIKLFDILFRKIQAFYETDI